jgi:hypothetical protein
MRPARRWPLIGAGIGLELVAVVGFVMVGTAPTDSEGTPTGAASSVGTGLLILSVIAAVVLGLVFGKRSPAAR